MVFLLPALGRKADKFHHGERMVAYPKRVAKHGLSAISRMAGPAGSGSTISESVLHSSLQEAAPLRSAELPGSTLDTLNIRNGVVDLDGKITNDVIVIRVTVNTGCTPRSERVQIGLRIGHFVLRRKLMRKLAMTILGSALLIGFAMPASAHEQYRHD